MPCPTWSVPLFFSFRTRTIHFGQQWKTLGIILWFLNSCYSLGLVVVVHSFSICWIERPRRLCLATFKVPSGKRHTAPGHIIFIHKKASHHTEHPSPVE